MRYALAGFISLLLTTAQTLAATLWDHEGSTVVLETTGSSRRFIFSVPRPGVPVSRGSVLFEGTRQGDAYTGRAFVVSPGCGTQSYPVTGVVSSDQRTVTLSGRAPGLSASCEPTEPRPVSLLFTYLRASDTALPLQPDRESNQSSFLRETDAGMRTQKNAAAPQVGGASTSRPSYGVDRAPSSGSQAGEPGIFGFHLGQSIIDIDQRSLEIFGAGVRIAPLTERFGFFSTHGIKLSTGRCGIMGGLAGVGQKTLSRLAAAGLGKTEDGGQLIAAADHVRQLVEYGVDLRLQSIAFHQCLFKGSSVSDVYKLSSVCASVFGRAEVPSSVFCYNDGALLRFQRYDGYFIFWVLNKEYWRDRAAASGVFE